MNGNCVQELTLLDQAKQALADASSFDQIKDIRDKAEAVRKYAQSASLGLDILSLTKFIARPSIFKKWSNMLAPLKTGQK